MNLNTEIAHFAVIQKHSSRNNAQWLYSTAADGPNSACKSILASSNYD